MILHTFQDRPPDPLPQALARFESRFTYPLGSHGRFQINHGDDYTLFYRSIGKSVCFVAEHGGNVLGTISAAIRPLVTPGGKEHPTLYVGDLKVSPESRNSRVLWRLSQALDQWARPLVDTAFSVVMDGTAAMPASYTGRVGIPSFQVLGKLVIFRIETASALETPSWRASEETGESCYQTLNHQRYAVKGGQPGLRSHISPFWMVHPKGRACGRLEDTQRAKRLILENGSALKSAHLACVAFDTIESASDLVKAALCEAKRAGLPALFLSIPQRDGNGLYQALKGLNVIRAPATVYGTGLEPGKEWSINSSEV